MWFNAEFMGIRQILDGDPTVKLARTATDPARFALEAGRAASAWPANRARPVDS
jgi:hypothetical protein